MSRNTLLLAVEEGLSMSKVDIWMPVYIGSYLADTMHLTTEQQGAYFLLLLYGWRMDGLIPSDDESLATITRLSPAAWAKNRPVISRFFEQGEFWTQKRQIEELEKAGKRRDAAKSNGIKGGRPKDNLRVSGGLTGGLPSGKAKLNPKKTSSSSSSSEPPPNQEVALLPVDPLFLNPDFCVAWDAWLETRKGKNKLTDHARALNLAELKRLSGGDVGIAIRIINQTTMNSWKGFFPLKDGGQKNGTSGKQSQCYESAAQRNSRKFQEQLGQIATGFHSGGGDEVLPLLPQGNAGEGDYGR